MKSLQWPLMRNNILREDLDAISEFLKQEVPILTQSSQVKAFEKEWGEWLGVPYCVFVNSGSSANQLTMFALHELAGAGEIIVPTLTWVSDIASVLQAGFSPVFVDINPETLGMDTQQVLDKLTARTRAVFLTHVLGYNALNRELLDGLAQRGIPLIEDVCESYGATFQGKKLGTFGLASNFSFYYAHHMSTIEGGMIATHDEKFYQFVRLFRAHGMVRESTSESFKSEYYEKYPDLNPDFIFAFPAFNARSTEINAVLGRNQLKRLDANNEKRRRNLDIFLGNLDSNRFYTEFRTEGSCNYAFTIVLRHPDLTLRDAVERTLRENGVEFRRGASGGGNQMRQPYLRRLFGADAWKDFPRVDHIHFFGYYVGNYPDLEEDAIIELCRILNSI
jgi:CDP-4-dehydro-6-deoxyglucose reductase, E1